MSLGLKASQWLYNTAPSSLSVFSILIGLFLILHVKYKVKFIYLISFEEKNSNWLINNPSEKRNRLNFFCKYYSGCVNIISVRLDIYSVVCSWETKCSMELHYRNIFLPELIYQQTIDKFWAPITGFPCDEARETFPLSENKLKSTDPMMQLGSLNNIHF